MMYGSGGMQAMYSCEACGGQFKEVTGDSGETTVEGQVHCFSGKHTLAAVPKSDQRVVDLKSLSLRVSPSLQREIDGLPRTHPGVRRLKISGSGMAGMGDGEALSFTVPLKKLKVLHLEDVLFSKVHLNDCPALEELELQNLDDDCDLKLAIPSLKRVKLNYFSRAGEAAVEEMLEAATRLEEFTSYKLWHRKLHFASTALRRVSIHRSDTLYDLSVWSPVLEELEIQACYSLDRVGAVALPDSHPRFPDWSGALSRNIEVNAVNTLGDACGGMEGMHRSMGEESGEEEALLVELKSHPRIGRVRTVNGGERYGVGSGGGMPGGGMTMNMF